MDQRYGGYLQLVDLLLLWSLQLWRSFLFRQKPQWMPICQRWLQMFGSWEGVSWKYPEGKRNGTYTPSFFRGLIVFWQLICFHLIIFIFWLCTAFYGFWTRMEQQRMVTKTLLVSKTHGRWWPKSSKKIKAWSSQSDLGYLWNEDILRGATCYLRTLKYCIYVTCKW